MTTHKHGARILAGVLALVGGLVGWGAFWYTAAAPLEPFVLVPRPVSVLFVGDIMLDRKVAQMAVARGVDSLFASSSELFNTTDLRVANLEGTITTNQSISQVNNSILHFTFDPTLTHDALAPLNLSAVSLANNHSLDFGVPGYQSTRQFVSSWGIQPFGSANNTAGVLSTRLEARGMSICLVGYMELYNASTTNVINEIQSLRSGCDKVVVFAHWGVEYHHDITTGQQAEARQFIDAGADLVIGAHPHVVEPMEVYKGKAIFYSLGNFMFDQNFSWDTTHGLAVSVDFYPSKTTLTLIPVTIVDERSAIAVGEDRDRVLTLVTGGTVATTTLSW